MPGELVADQRAHLRAVGLALFRLQLNRDFLVESGDGLALLGIHEFLQLVVGRFENRDVDLEIAAHLVDDACGDELEAVSVSASPVAPIAASAR